MAKTSRLPIPPSRQVLVLADDLTGALESGAAFAQRGIEGAVTIGKPHRVEKPVLVIDTETRHASEEQAAATSELSFMRFQCSALFCTCLPTRNLDGP
jgi:uncharacterized protein YgbK (DUF1537 family)